MAELLLNETKALQHLQSLKYQASKEMQDEKTSAMLVNMAQPLRWQLHNNETALVHTPETQRAKYLLDLFNKLQELSNNAEINSIQSNEVQRKSHFVDERLQLLVTIKWEVNEYRQHFVPSQEMIELIDREADLLSRNRPLKSMSNLRSRLMNLFLQFIQNPACNPRAGDFLVEKKD